MRSSFCIQCIPPGVWAICVVGLLVSAWGGSKLVHKPTVTTDIPPPVDITVRFFAYDTKGQPLSGVFIESTSPIPKPIPRTAIAREGFEHSEPEPTSGTLKLTYGGQQRDEVVTWKAGDRFKNWLKDPLRDKLNALDPGYDKAKWQELAKSLQGQVSGTKFHYPVIFRAIQNSSKASN